MAGQALKPSVHVKGVFLASCDLVKKSQWNRVKVKAAVYL